MNFRAAAQFIYNLITGSGGSGSMSEAEATKLAREAHVNAHYLFTDPQGHLPGDYPGHYSGALSDSFTTLLFKENQRWKVRMGFDQAKFFAGQHLRGKGATEYANGFDYATTGDKSLKTRGYKGPADALRDVGYSPVAGSESEWFVQTQGVMVQFQGGAGGGV